MKPTFFLAAAAFISILGSRSEAEQMTQMTPIVVQIEAAQPNGIVKVQITNNTSGQLRIWHPECNSWGWNNWYFEFFDENDLTVFVRRPNEGFTANMPAFMDIPPTGSASISFDLNDGSWVPHQLPIFKPWMKGFRPVKGCIAVLAIPMTADAKKFSIWTGTIASSFR